ncbi:MAG: HTTM domain-containing protein [Halobacterium sp.]
MTAGFSRDGVERVRHALARRFGVEVRALAALRVALASLVLVDLLLRARFLTAFYTDAGVLPRSLLADQFGVVSQFSVHALSGAAWWQGALFALTAACALAMLAGYRTTLATLLTGLLVASLHYRNPYVLNSGDTLLRMLFLWGVFLPVGRRWSVDALRETADTPGSTERVASVATAGLLVQVVVVYATNAVLKLRGDAWVGGDAVRQVLHLDMFTVLLGDVLAQYLAVLAAFSHLWLAMLVASPLLVAFTGRARAALAGLFAAMHAGMFLSMQLGVFPFVSIAALLPFLPAAVWDRLSGRCAIPGVRRLPIARYAERIETALPLVSLPALPQVLRRLGRRVVPVLLAVLVVGLVAWNAATVGLLGVPAAAPVAESPEPRWGMFAPEPAGTDFWVVAPGTLASGARVDAFHGGPVEWAEPPDVAASYPGARWRKYVSNVRAADDPAVARGFADYLCTPHDGSGADRLVAVQVFLVEQSVDADGAGATRRVELAAVNCTA